MYTFHGSRAFTEATIMNTEQWLEDMLESQKRVHLLHEETMQTIISKWLPESSADERTLAL